ncbi:MAG: SDR family NAD(P)-dependent oxidoreductase [Leptolyngbyaceae cyanobacterium bins.349]|nr:SDR family NAD(P)-dependent oxidoreductase [Leptolyngbyaceae cyanobacterium bins.349]
MSDVLVLNQSVVLITGASTGIGAALARQLAGQHPGIRLVLAARNQDKLATVAAACQTAGAETLIVPTDLAHIQQAQALAHQALDHFGQVDVLINNAGYGQMGPLELMTPEECRRQFEVNVMGPLALTQAVIPAMRDRGGGRIINISSIGGRTAFPFGGLYSGSKFALEAISDALRMELEPFNIKVSVVEPGAVHNEFLDVVKHEIETAVPDPQSTPYRAAFATFSQLDKRTKATAWTSDQVARVIIHALNAKHPRPRYVAATAGSFLVFMLTKVLPTKAVDRFWQRFYGIDQVAKDWRHHKEV